MTASTARWPRVLVFCFFLVGVNLLAGYVAISFNYPSLYNVSPRFSEYAFPLNFNWALAHWPSMLLFGLPLLALPDAGQKFAVYFRSFCAVSFGVLLLFASEKIPFVLFPTIDALVALVLSFVVLPPGRKTSPVQFAVMNVALLAVFGIAGFQAISYWQHRAPAMTTTEYAGGMFVLTGITVDSDFRKQMLFTMDLTQYMASSQSCQQAQPVASALLEDYPFDPAYDKRIEVTFNPPNPEAPQHAGAPYLLGELSLNTDDMSENGEFACYLTFINDIF